MNYIPANGDTVVFAEIHNTEVVILGVLEATDMQLSSGDLIIHRGVKVKQGEKENYTLKSRITMGKDFSITMET